MKELELEAEKYANELIESKAVNQSDKTWIKSIYNHIVLRSKYVEKQKLEFAIKQLQEFEAISWNVTEKIEKLEQKLKELKQ